jgi:hypothetical protein
MSSHPYDTRRTDPWHTEIVPQLPPDLAVQATALGAYVRYRHFTNATDLLRGLLAYAATASSLRHLGAWGVLQDVADLAPSSWLDRLRTAGPWLQWIVSTQLQIPRPRWLRQAVRGRVLLVDASCLGWHGGHGNEFRLHLAVDLLAGQLDQVVLTDRYGGEQVTHFALRVGDLLVMDGGYGFRDRVAAIQQAQADAVVRIYPPTFPLVTSDGRPLDVRAWLDGLRRGQGSRIAYYQHDGRRAAVRVLAYRLPEPQRQAAQHKAKNRARKRQRPLHAVPAYFADWVVLVTTLQDAETWPDAAIWRLYGARWQVELLIKRMKQCLAIGTLRCRTLASGVPLVWALLVIWVLHEPHLDRIRRDLHALARPHPATLPGQLPDAEAVVSTWGLSRLLLETVLLAIRGTWTLAHVQACVPRLQRYLVMHPRSDRVHQATEVGAWLSGVRRTRRASLPDAP